MANPIQIYDNTESLHNIGQFIMNYQPYQNAFLSAIVNRIGLTTSKALGGAVIRSRCRRLIREAMRLVIKERPMKVGFLIVIAARHGIIPLKCDEVKRQLEYALGKLDMFKKGQDV